MVYLDVIHDYLNIPSFPTFDLDDQTIIVTRWEKYKKRFSNLCVTLNIKR